MKSLNNYIIESKLEEININKLINYIKNNISGYKIELSEEIPEIFE